MTEVAQTITKDQMDKTEVPFTIKGTDHIQFYVGNAKQAAHYYRALFGFRPVAYKGLETGSRDAVSYVLEQNKIRFVLTTPLNPESTINDHLRLHGDGVRDIALWVSDAKAAYDYTVGHGAAPVLEPKSRTDDHGEVVTATIHTYGDTLHTFVERREYKGPFLPGYEILKALGPIIPVGINFVDHIVGNQPDGEMEVVANWYQSVFGFHRMWTVDDKDIRTEFSALRSIVVANDNERIKMPINEPAAGLKKSQIQEYIDFYKSAGVQHIALDSKDIITTVGQLRKNGVEFLEVPNTYYEELTKRVGTIDEDIDKLAEHGILVDRDEDGYLLQIFTKPVEDRPTLFYEVIQRKGARSFGKGNFKALFESIEREQARRGNL